MKRGRNIKFL